MVPCTTESGHVLYVRLMGTAIFYHYVICNMVFLKVLIEILAGGMELYECGQLTQKGLGKRTLLPASSSEAGLLLGSQRGKKSVNHQCESPSYNNK